MSNCRPGDKVCAALSYIQKLKFCTYCRRKTYSQLSMDVALIMVNAAHLTQIIRIGYADKLYIVKVCLVCISIFLEVLIGIILTLKERYDIYEESHHKFLTYMNDFAMFLVFFSVLVHVFVSVFVEHPHAHIPLHGKYRFPNCSAT